MPFSYPALPKGVDAIRVLKLEPGDFVSPLAGTLAPAAFSDRPKYVALSYTWGSSYFDNSKLPLSLNDAKSPAQSPSTSPNRSRSGVSPNPKERKLSSTDQPIPRNLLRPEASASPTATKSSSEINLDGQPFPIGHNLHLALLHLRSPTHSISIWIDAICINQADTMERNSQVSLMAFIYTRATKVVAWLGTKNYPSMTGLLRSMSFEWKAGHTQHFGAFLVGDIKMRYSPKPDLGTFVRILDSSYWKRLWIVQELCLPRILVFMYGSDIWTYEGFKKWEYPQLVQPEASSMQPISGYSEAASRLFETRDKRHTDLMRLETLIERFAKSQCSESRDRIFGLLGCANDIRPFVGRNDRADRLMTHIDSLSSGVKSSYQPQRGIGSIRVDYHCPLYEIWTNLVGFIYFQAKELKHNANILEIVKILRPITENPGKTLMLEERQISIVRTASIIQDALGQKIEEELAGRKPNPVSRRKFAG
jgi:hypothetical protein